MPARYRVDIKDPSGTKVAEFADWLDLSFERRVNAPGGFVLRLSGEDGRTDYLEENCQVEVWRRYPELGLDWYVEAEYLLEDIEDSVPERTRVIVASGRGYLSLCDRRIVAAAAGSSQANKSGPAETVIKEIVTEQLGSGASGERQITGLTVQADPGGGNTVSKAFAYRNVLAVLQDLAEPGGLDFDIVGTGPAQYEFRTYIPHRGTDRRGNVTFALNYDNMGKPVWTVRRSAVRNAVLVGGQGEGAGRETVWCTESGITAWTRREVFVDARHLETTEALENRGDAELAENRKHQSLSFEVLQTWSLAYGRDYSLGDLVRAVYAGQVVDKKIVAVQIEVTRDGEKITPELADVL